MSALIYKNLLYLSLKVILSMHELIWTNHCKVPTHLYSKQNISRESCNMRDIIVIVVELNGSNKNESIRKH